MQRIALVVGVSGIGGSNTARELIRQGWVVYGLARRPSSDVQGVRPLAADLLDPASLATALSDVSPTHVFFTTWLRQSTEAENIRVNAAMVRNLLDALQALEHQAGRLRPYMHAPRTLDLDLLFYGDAQMHSPRLMLPHPRWRDRAFVLYPLADVAPERVSDEDLTRVAGQAIERLPPVVS